VVGDSLITSVHSVLSSGDKAVCVSFCLCACVFSFLVQFTMMSDTLQWEKMSNIKEALKRKNMTLNEKLTRAEV